MPYSATQNLVDAYNEFNESGADVYSRSGEYYSATLAFIAGQFGISMDKLADYIAYKWGTYPYD